MRFLLRRLKSLNAIQQANGTAVSVAVLTILFLHLECQPRPAGADTVKVTVFKTGPVIAKTAKIEQPAVTTPEPLTEEQLHERTLAKRVELLEKGLAFLKATPDYTAQFTKRELVNGDLLEEQTILMKLRHEPFSVYLKWVDFEAGREVMYVDGLNDGQMVVHSGGWKAKLPALLLAPDGTLAMKQARYPVTRVGLLALAETIIGYNRKDLELKNYASCRQLEDQTVGDRLCHHIVLEYKHRTTSKDYRKSVTMIDKEWCVPVLIQNYGWPDESAETADADLDEATLLEHYTYTDIKFRSALTSLDFDHTNEDYNFRRQ